MILSILCILVQEFHFMVSKVFTTHAALVLAARIESSSHSFGIPDYKTSPISGEFWNAKKIIAQFYFGCHSVAARLHCSIRVCPGRGRVCNDLVFVSHGSGKFSRCYIFISTSNTGVRSCRGVAAITYSMLDKTHKRYEEFIYLLLHTTWKIFDKFLMKT